ncbi:hypothetical protein, partial [Francisella tularensis]|uniref:hypothetical protein n=1 Tax=Francisella tularensis TaxID=263 RepID=UPI001CC30353
YFNLVIVILFLCLLKQTYFYLLLYTDCGTAKAPRLRSSAAADVYKRPKQVWFCSVPNLV